MLRLAAVSLRLPAITTAIPLEACLGQGYVKALVFEAHVQHGTKQFGGPYAMTSSSSSVL